MRQHAGVFAANFSSNLLWQNCFAPKKSAFCAEPRRAAAGILDVCQGGATTGLRETRLLRRVFFVAGGLKPGALVFVSGCGLGGGGFDAAGGVRGSGCAGFARLRDSGSTFGSGGGTGRGFGGSLSFGGVCAGSGLLASGGVIASALAGLRSIIINRRCYYFFLRLFNDGLFDFDDSGIGNGGYYNVGLLLRNLALKYSINMNIVNETVGVNKAGRGYKLSDYLQVKTLSQEESRIGDISFLRLTDASSGATMRKVRKVILIQPKGASIWDETTGTL